MTNITLRFYCLNIPVFGWLIQAITRHWSNHVDLISDGESMISALPPFGVQEWPQRILAGAMRIEDVVIPCTPEQRGSVLAFAREQIGKPYDYLGLIAFPCRPKWNDPQRWFCSELCAAALSASGVLIIPVSVSRISPKSLYRIACDARDLSRDLY